MSHERIAGGMMFNPDLPKDFPLHKGWGEA
jgi:hypothetical protein